MTMVKEGREERKRERDVYKFFIEMKEKGRWSQDSR